MSKKMKSCGACGAEIAASAKTCPKCGAKNKPPVYKRWWFYAIIVIIVFIAIGSSGSSETTGTKGGTSPAVSDKTPKEPEAPPVSYTPYDVTELFEALSSNALKAEKTFKNQYVEIEGYLSTIDSDGKYISIGAGSENWDYIFQSVQCYVKSEEQLDQIMEMTSGDLIVVRGKIKSIGEVLGYQMDIDSIN